ncbi:EF-P 5-aminopentanol modification-associated protein YfmH [Streptococcus intermedius]|uniref:EF-P 5-aminopentanol modification-associated protein YfmH n=1 Tax=Streptococcus intermedius TaxID=1338 RepID=UPI000E3BCA21|nr:pitrilysin family protein [Streptococcus intermedius]
MQPLKIERKDYPAVGEVVYQSTLQNGLRVFFLPKQEFNEIYGIMTVNFGSIDTRFIPHGANQVVQYPAGVAHFLEHKLFEDKHGQDILQQFVELGAESNAFTSFTKTSYLFSATDNVLESVSLLQSLLGNAYFTEESVQREQEIIQQEIDMYKDNPDYCLYFHTLANLYPDTPLAEDIAGSVESVTEITVEDLDKNFESFYCPSNMSLLLIGDFDLEKTITVIQEQQECLESFAKQDFIQRFPLTLNPVISTGSVRMEVASSKLAIGLRGNQSLVGINLFRYKISLKLLFAMMFGWTSKRFQSLYELGKIDNSLSLEVEVEKDFHFVMLTMDTSEPVALSHQFRSVIWNFENDPDVTEEHLDTIKSEMFGDFLHGLNSLEYIATQYETFVEGENLFDLPKILQTISLVDIVEIGHHFIDSCEMVDFTIFPK